MRLVPKPPVRKLRHPAWQLAAATGVMVGGAYLIAVWMVGAVLMAAGMLWAFDAVVRDSKPSKPASSANDQVLDRWRQAR